MTSHTPQKLSTRYTEKLSRNATALSTLFLLPAVSQAVVISNNNSLTVSLDDARAFDYQPVDWDIDGNSVADFRLDAFRTVFSSFYSTGYGNYFSSSRPTGSMYINAVSGAEKMVADANGNLTSMPLSALVGPKLPAAFQWGPGDNRMMSSSSYFGSPTTSLTDQSLIGFSFIGDADQVLYGWAQISLDFAALSMTVDEWAYETNGGSIRVGQVSSVPVPPSALLMLSGLALGAGGILRGRKLRKDTNKQASETV